MFVQNLKKMSLQSYWRHLRKSLLFTNLVGFLQKMILENQKLHSRYHDACSFTSIRGAHPKPINNVHHQFLLSHLRGKEKRFST